MFAAGRGGYGRHSVCLQGIAGVNCQPLPQYHHRAAGRPGQELSTEWRLHQSHSEASNPAFRRRDTVLMGPGAVSWNTSVPLKERNYFPWKLSKSFCQQQWEIILKSYFAGKCKCTPKTQQWKKGLACRAQVGVGRADAAPALQPSGEGAFQRDVHVCSRAVPWPTWFWVQCPVQDSLGLLPKDRIHFTWPRGAL